MAKTANFFIMSCLLIMGFVIAGCSSGGSSSGAASLVSIAVTPTNPTIAKLTSKQFTATGTYSDNTTKDLTTQVTWSSGSPLVATIFASGKATGVAAGTSVITATSGTISATTTLTVTSATLSSIALIPANPSIAKGTTQQYLATGTFNDSTTQDITASVTWTSSDTAVATITSTTGLATALTVGTSTITATLGTVSQTSTLTVNTATLSSIAVTPANPSAAAGSTKQFTATGTFTDASTQDLTTQVAWSSSDVTKATIVANSGLATAVAAGAPTITATLGSISGATTFTVTAATLQSIAVTPANSSVAQGLSVPFVATGTYSNATTQILTSQVTWTSSDTSKATISNAAGTNGNALASSVATGATTITATLGTVSGSTGLTVTAATLQSIAVSTTTPSVSVNPAGTTAQFHALGTYSSGLVLNIDNLVAWTSSDTSVATVGNAVGTYGLATTVGAGTTTITATLAPGTPGTATLTVTSAALSSIAVTPTNATITVGNVQFYTATGTYVGGATQNLTSLVTWSVVSGTTATISNAAGTKGIATGVSVGPTTFRATSGAINSNTVSLEVE